MARVARVVAPSLPHHVTQRGNRQEAVFADDTDRETYLRILQYYAAREALDIWAYCLMPNHIHLVVVPDKETSLAVALRNAHTSYARYFNAKSGFQGHLWQGRFFSCVLDEPHLWAAVRYVERNPVRAGIVRVPEEYRWSSAPAHCGLRSDPIISTTFPFPGAVPDWAVWLRTQEDAIKTDALRRNTRIGRPCGSEDFLDRIERALGRSVRRRKAGRRPRQSETKPKDTQ